MPTTRQATPGSSTALPMKRSASTDTEDSVDAPKNKKPKRDKSVTNSPLTSMNGTSQTQSKDKDKKKKRRTKKKRKASIVVTDPAPARQTRSRSVRTEDSAAGAIAEPSIIPPTATGQPMVEPEMPPESHPGPPELAADSDSGLEEQGGTSSGHVSLYSYHHLTLQ